MPYITRTNIIENDSLGVYIADNAKPNLGGRGHNNIYGSGCYEVYNNTPNKISAKSNYWGTMDLDSIQSHIYDHHDNESLGVVLIEPLWDGDHCLGGPMSQGQEETPITFALRAPSPNPFSSTTTIAYSIPKSEHVSLKIYDISGKCIRILEDGNKNAGMHCVTWDGLDNLKKRIPTGIYFIQLTSDDFIGCRKILVIK